MCGNPRALRFAQHIARELHGAEPRTWAGWVFRKSVTGHFGIVTDDFGNVTGHFGDMTDRLSAVF